MAGLRFTRTAGQTSTPLETRSGSYIYNGDPAYFHDWEFRTLMRLKLYEDAIKAKAQKKASRRNSRRSPTPQDEPTDADAEVEAPGEEPEGGGDLASLAAAMSRESPSDTSRSSKHGKSSKPSVTSRASHGPKDLPKGDDLDELSASATQARTEMVQKVLEGLREEAFELARDIGVDVLTQPGGLRKFVKKLRDVVFPRASEEARELFKAGQKPGSLARQNGESMLSYVSHEPRAMVMEGGDKKFYLGQHRNETYSEVAKKIEFIQWLMAQSRVICPCRIRSFSPGSIGTTLSKMEVYKLGLP